MGERKSPNMELFQLFMFMFFGLFMATFLMSAVYGIEGITEENSQDPTFFFITSGGVQFLAFLMPPILIIKMSGQSYKNFFAIGKTSLNWIGITVVTFVFGYIVMQILGSINSRLEDIFPNSEVLLNEHKQDELINAIVSTPGIPYLLSSILVIGVITPICEELFFRGFLLGSFLRISKGNKHFAVITSSLIFAALHLQPLKILPMFFLALCLGYLYTEGKNLKYPILFHSLINTSQILIAYFIGIE